MRQNKSVLLDRDSLLTMRTIVKSVSDERLRLGLKCNPEAIAIQAVELRRKGVTTPDMLRRLLEQSFRAPPGR